MATAAVLAAALTDHTAHPWGLYVGGRDMIRGADGFGVPLDTIEVTEQGPGGVSSIRFVLEDPAGTYVPQDLDPITMWDLARNDPAFRGVLDHWESAPMAPAGRRITIEGVGIEAALDEIKILPGLMASELFGSLSYLGPLLWALVNRSGRPLEIGHQPWDDGSGYVPSYDGTAVQPIGWTGDYPETDLDLTGKTLREAIRQLEELATPTILPHGSGLMLTIDFLGRVRLWRDRPAIQPDDYVTLTVSDTLAGALAASDLRFANEPGEALHEVFVTGAGGTEYGWFTDGTGLRGRQDRITTPAASAAEAAIFAANALEVAAPTVRGSLRLEDCTPPVGVHAGGLLDLVDAASGATGIYRIMSIGKAWRGDGLQTWTIAFGGHRPSLAKLVRSLTRDVSI